MLALKLAGQKLIFMHRAGSDVAEGVAAVLKLIVRCPIWTAHSTVWAGVAQLVEHLICNQRVGGSNPSVSSKAPVLLGWRLRSIGARRVSRGRRKMHRWPSG